MPNEILPKAYSYVRFSSPKQKLGRSHERQRKDCIEYCRINKLDLVTTKEYTYLDAGKSGFHGKHVEEGGALCAFLDKIKSGDIPRGSYLIVESLDRLGREKVRAALTRFLNILESGVNIVTLTDHRVYKAESHAGSDMEIVMSIFEMSRAHSESLHKAVRSGDSWGSKKELARTEKKVNSRQCPMWLEVVGEKGSYAFKEIAPRVEAIKKIFNWAVTGSGKSAIVKKLLSEKIPTFSNKSTSWAESSVWKLLHNRAVFGEYQPYSRIGGVVVAEGEPIKDYYPEVIPEDLFKQVQDAMNSRKQSKATKPSANCNVFQGVVVCALCGSTLHLIDKGKPPKGVKYLRCYRARTKECSAKAIRLDVAEKVLAEEILPKLDALSLVQESSAAMEKKLRILEIDLNSEKSKLSKFKSIYEKDGEEYAYSVYLKSQATINELTLNFNQLKAAQATQEIVDKAGFIAALDMESYDKRYQTNLLLKRLEIKISLSERDNHIFFRISDENGNRNLFYLIYNKLLKRIDLLPINEKVLSRALAQENTKTIFNSLELARSVFDEIKEQYLDGNMSAEMKLNFENIVNEEASRIKTKQNKH